MTDTEGSLTQRDAPRAYVGAYALCFDPHSDARRLLLCRMAQGYLDEGRWTLPGGGLEWGESPEDGVSREVEEETGLTLTGAKNVVGVYSKTYLRGVNRPAHSVHHLGIIYRVAVSQGTLRAEHGGSTDRCDFFTREEAKNLPLVPLASFALPLAWPRGYEVADG